MNVRFAQSAPAWPRQVGVAAPSGRGRQRAGAARHLTDSSSASLHLCAACGKLDYSAWGVRLPMQFCAGERVHMASKPTAISMRVVWLHKKSTRLRWFAICRACRCELCCAVLCRGVLCCVVLCVCCTVLCCCDELSCGVLRCAAMCYAALRCATLRCAVLRCAALCCAVLLCEVYA